MQLKIFSSFIILIVLCVGVFADNDRVSDTKRNDYNTRIAHISCKIDLTKQQIDILSAIDSNISSHKTALDNDLIKLKEFASAFNHKEFNDYFSATLKSNLRDSAKAIRDIKLTDFRRSNLISRDEKLRLRDSHKLMMDEYSECVKNSENDWADKRAGHLNSWIEKWEDVIEHMKEKGYDPSEMETVVADANSKLLPALEAIRNANTKEVRRAAMQDARNLHLHLWARFEVARVFVYLKFIEADAVAKGYQTEVDAIKGKLNGVSNLVVPGKTYGPGEFNAVWKAIKESVDMLKELNRKLKA